MKSIHGFKIFVGKKSRGKPGKWQNKKSPRKAIRASRGLLYVRNTLRVRSGSGVFLFRIDLVDDLLGQITRHFIILLELHGEGTAAAGHGA